MQTCWSKENQRSLKKCIDTIKVFNLADYTKIKTKNNKVFYNAQILLRKAKNPMKRDNKIISHLPNQNKNHLS